MKTIPHRSLSFIISALMFMVLIPSHGRAAESRPSTWPPGLDENNPTTQTSDGRVIERFVHGPRETWGYLPVVNPGWNYPVSQETGPAQQNINSFYIVHPKQARENAPMCVVLHSANRTAYDYLGFGCLDRKLEPKDDPATVMTRVPDDFYTLYLNSTNDEWWGWAQMRGAPDHAQRLDGGAPPAEKRVLDTIDWISSRYHVDRNRIYLCGVSMGGCGTLGIGMPNGNVFAAVLACVPAGTGYASYRMGGFAPSPAADASADERDAWKRRAAGVERPDPPVIVDFSSQTDMWATTQPALVQAAQAGRLPLVLCWGTFGHTTFGSLIAKHPTGEVALAFPWLEIRKNQAYPVFTHATSDQRCPWLNAPAEYDNAGQMNAWFRWKSVADTNSKFVIQLWIEHPIITGSLSMPETATADVTLRRLQQFKVRPTQKYAWRLSQGGRLIESGTITADAENLLTIPKVKIGTSSAELSLQAEEK